MPPKLTKDQEKFLSRYPEPTRKLLLKARAIIWKVRPDWVEKLYPGWRILHYSFDGKMNSACAYLGPNKAGVNFGFFDGVSLPDPHGMLEGDGKKMRHVKIAEGFRDWKYLQELVALQVAVVEARLGVDL